MKFYFDLKYPKMATLEGGCEVASVLVLRSMCPFTFQKCPSVPRIALLFSRSTLFFPEFPFCFLEVFFCFSEVPFYFWKIPYCFGELSFSFLEVPSISLLCKSFSKNTFFAADCTFSSCSELVVREIIFTFSCFVFSWNSLLTLYWLMMRSW